MGKGSKRRPCALTFEAEQLQWDRFQHKITEEKYWQKRKELENSGRWWRK